MTGQEARVKGPAKLSGNHGTGQEARDERDCPACGFDPMAPHNGKGVCPPRPQEARDDERETVGVTVEPIAFAVYGRSTGGLKYVSEWDEEDAREAAQFYDVVPLHRAEPARKHPEPEITDEMIERAALALHDEACGDETCDHIVNEFEPDARAALEAALRVPVEEGEQ